MQSCTGPGQGKGAEQDLMGQGQGKGAEQELMGYVGSTRQVAPLPVLLGPFV